LDFRVFGKFPQTAWWAMHSCQAVHTFCPISGFLKRNHLVVSSRSPSNVCLKTLFELSSGDEHSPGDTSPVGSILVFSGFWGNF